MLVNNQHPTLLDLTALRAAMAKDTHFMIHTANSPTSHTRHCVYCGQPAPTAFYVTARKAFSCVQCYVAKYTQPTHSEAKVAS